MSTPQDDRFIGTAELPPYRAMLVVDMKNFSGNPSRYQPRLKELMPEIMRSAFARCGLASVWGEVTFQDTTGDGYCVGLPTSRLPFLLMPYLGALQAELADRNRLLPRGGHDAIRLRVSVSVGPVTDSGEGVLRDGVGDSRIELHRLLDSTPVRTLLENASDVTCVAAIVSGRVFEDAVLSRYADDDPSLYVEVEASEKTYQGTAYLRVPQPSGRLLEEGFRGFGTSADGRDASRPSQRYDAGRQRGAEILGNVGAIVNEPSGPVHTGAGNQYIGGTGSDGR
jgi:hypothetical protein